MGSGFSGLFKILHGSIRSQEAEVLGIWGLSTSKELQHIGSQSNRKFGWHPSAPANPKPHTDLQAGTPPAHMSLILLF